MNDEKYLVFCPKCAHITFSDKLGLECGGCHKGVFVKSNIATDSMYNQACEYDKTIDWKNIPTDDKSSCRLEQRIYEQEIIPMGQLETCSDAYKRSYWYIYGGNYGGIDPATGKKLVPPKLATNTPQYTPNIPKCPICGSTNLKKISAANKVGSVALFGLLAAGHVSKTWKCENCGNKF